MADMEKIILAYSSGPDTLVILKRLQDTYNCKVVTFTAGLGRGKEIGPARTRVHIMGIRKVYIDDLHEELVRDFVYLIFRINAVYEDEYPLDILIARPLITRCLTRIVNETGADAVSHDTTGKGNDRACFELGACTLKPGVKVIAP